MTIEVTWDTTWDTCDHAGCSGPEIATVTARKGNKIIQVEYASCFGVDKERLVAELLEKWEQ